MTATSYPNACEQNGFTIVRTPTGIGCTCVDLPTSGQTFTIEVYYFGRKLGTYHVNPVIEPRWREFYAGVDMLKCVVRILDGPTVVAELGLPPEEFVHPFMVVQGEQGHITESYVSVPPALHITDEVGARWTLDFATQPKEKSPKGEFAFYVLRDGVNTGEIASRIERRNGKVRCFTKHGWKNWTGRTFV